MPGVNCLICPTEFSAKAKPPVLLLAQERQKLFPHFSTNTSLPGPHALCYTETHQNYGINFLKQGDWEIWLEYQNESPIDQNIWQLLLNFEGEAPPKLDLKKLWEQHLGSIPASFFVVALNNARKLCVFANDALARLPVYLFHDEEMLILARDLGFLKAIRSELQPDPLYLSLFTAFAYIPGHGSFYREVDTLQGATLGVHNWELKQLQSSAIPELRFPQTHRKGTRKLRLEQLAAAFETALIRQSGDKKVLCSLSGGYDSRAIAAALSRQNMPFTAITYRDRDKTADEDLKVSQQLARLLKQEHQVLELTAASASDIARLYSLKQGLNYFGVTFLIEYLEQVSQAHPYPSVFFTGDGGDKVMPCLLPERKLHTDSELLVYLLGKNCIFSLAEACMCFDLPLSQARDYLLEVLNSYGSISRNEQYKRFMLSERAGRWLFEGEDRNRAYVHTESPFYDLDFYRMALQIPDNWKQGKQFYAQLIRYLHPQLAKINIAGSKETPYMLSSQFLAWGLQTYRKLRYEYLSKAPSSPVTLFPGHAQIAQRILNYRGNSCVQSFMNKPERMLNPDFLNSLSRSQIYTLYTVLAVISDEI